MCSSTVAHAAYYRELAVKLEELTHIIRQGSQQNLALVERLTDLTAQIREDIKEAV